MVREENHLLAQDKMVFPHFLNSYRLIQDLTAYFACFECNSPRQMCCRAQRDFFQLKQLHNLSQINVEQLFLYLFLHGYGLYSYHF